MHPMLSHRYGTRQRMGSMSARTQDQLQCCLAPVAAPCGGACVVAATVRYVLVFKSWSPYIVARHKSMYSVKPHTV